MSIFPCLLFYKGTDGCHVNQCADFGRSTADYLYSNAIALSDLQQ